MIYKGINLIYRGKKKTEVDFMSVFVAENYIINNKCMVVSFFFREVYVFFVYYGRKELVAFVVEIQILVVRTNLHSFSKYVYLFKKTSYTQELKHIQQIILKYIKSMQFSSKMVKI